MTTLLFTVACTTATKSGQQKSETKNSVALNTGFIATPVAQWDKSECRTPSNKYDKHSWKALVSEANACLKSNKWSNVEEIGYELSRRDTKSPWGPYYLGLKAESENALERALWMAELTVKRAPNMGIVHFQKGRILWKKEAFTESLEAFTKSLQLDPNMIDAHLFVGQIHFRDQSYAKAALHFQSVLRARPRDPTALMGLAECNIQSSDGRGAIEYLERGGRHCPTDPIFLIRQAFVYENLLNDGAKALEVYTFIQNEYKNGKYQRVLDFDLEKKISDLKMSIHGNRSLAGSGQGGIRK